LQISVYKNDFGIRCTRLSARKQQISPKELAGFDGSKIFHFVFKPPFDMELLPPEAHLQNTLLIDSHHCIEWSTGFTPVHNMKNIITHLTNKYDTIYVKGREQFLYLKQFISKPVVELEEHPALSATEPKCLFHTKDNCYCALSNVYFIYENIMMS
jgi:hypothetical protein